MAKIMDGVSNADKDLDSFLLIGQSNMAGRGDFNEVEDIENPLCFMFRMGRWLPMSEPINVDRQIFKAYTHSGVCLGASFADSYAKTYNRQVGLIPCADGGTAIEEWLPGGFLFENTLFQVKHAVKKSNLKGILWHQGENDCVDKEKYDLYSERFETFITALKKSIGIEDIPFIAGELSENLAERLNMQGRNIEFNKMLPTLLKKHKNTAVVSAKGLGLKDDELHFNSKSLREFGVRYFNAYKSVIEKE